MELNILKTKWIQAFEILFKKGLTKAILEYNDEYKWITSVLGDAINKNKVKLSFHTSVLFANM